MSSTFPHLDARKIDDWANNREAHHQLPELVRRLLLVSGSITGISMPSGSAIAMPGVDGWVRSSDATPWIPAGESIWELSCNNNPVTKADSDYDKRTHEIPAERRRQMSYVQLTARRWNKKNEWAEAKRQEAEWADVRALDALDLEAWLKEHAPVALVLAEWLGIAGHGILSPDTYFHDWASKSEPAISVPALLTGRERAVNSLVSQLRARDGQQKHISLLADSSEEAVAIACAAVSSCPDLAGRSIVIDALEGRQFVQVNPGIDIVIATSPEIASRNAGFQGTVVFPVHQGLLAGRQDNQNLVSFARPLRDEFAKGLSDLGVPHEEAERQAVLTGRSWSAWRRLHPAAPGLLTNLGEVGEKLNGRLAATLCLIDMWNDENDDDWDFIAKVGDFTREDAERAMRELAAMDDPPVIDAGGVWKVKAPLEFFLLHARLITSPLLKRFLSEAKGLLEEIDPLLRHPPTERFLASLQGDEKLRGSEALRRAVADGLARLAVLAPEHDILQRLNPKSQVNSLVRDLLHDADLHRWITLSGLLPALAEAAPEAFLAAVEAGASDDKSAVATLTCLHEEDLLTDRIYRTGLLWALERLAWNPALLPRVALILAHLARLPIEDNWANRPLNSLVDLFRFWWPQTCADVEQRREILELLSCEVPDVAWLLLKELLRFGHDTASPISRPVWRDWGKDCTMRPDRIEWVESLHHAAQLMFDLVDTDVGKLKPLVMQVAHLHALDSALTEKLFEKLKLISREGNDRKKALLRDVLRNVLHRPHRLTDILKQKCRAAWEELAPHDVVVRHAWLFNQAPGLPEEMMMDWEREEEKLQQWRSDAVNDVFREAGWDGISRLMQEAKDPWSLGVAVAMTELDAITEHVISLQLEYRKGLEYSFLGGYLHGMENDQCVSFLRLVLDRAREENWETERTVIFLTAAPFRKHVWELVEQTSREIRALFWARCHPRPAFFEGEEGRKYALLVARRLLDAGRPWSLLTVLSLRVEMFPERILEELLERIIAGEEMEAVRNGDTVMARHHLGKVVNLLESSVSMDRNRLARLEYGLLPLFLRDNPERFRALMQAIMSDPSLFVDLLCKVYRSECENNENEDEQVMQDISSMLWELFHSHLSTQPGGTSQDEEVDQVAFHDFVEKVLSMAKERCRRRMAEHVLGQIIARGPKGSDDLVPYEAARSVLDKPELEEMRNGFRTGLYNGRGVTTRSPYEGGQQERELAARFRENAERMRTRHPRLAATLDSLAQTYENEARRHDEDAEQRRELP